MKLSLLITITGLLASAGYAQSTLDQYVEIALEHNLAVQEKRMLEQRQAYSLEHAARLFGPEVGFLTSYTLATGGRSIDFPVGTLLNDVYSTLNNLTGTQNFSPLENQTITFLPHNFYDTRFRITQPILQPEIKYNRLIKKEELQLAGLQTDQTTRDLIHDVKTTYLQWLQAREGIRILDQGLDLLAENKRISESLIKNGSALPSSLLRIDSEITLAEAQRKKAESEMMNAASYFNFLLSRPSDSPIEADTFPDAPDIPSGFDVAGREELQQIRTNQAIQNLALTIEEKHFAPRIGVQVDVGSQAYAVDGGGYVLGGIQLEIPIWDNKKSQLKRKEWQASIASTQAQYDYARQALETQLINALNSLSADLVVYNSYTASVLSNQRYYAETARRYKEGLANHIELLDARTQVTNTLLLQNIAKYQSWIRYTEIERISASVPIP